MNSIQNMNNCVWAPDPIEGYVKGVIIDIKSESLTVKLDKSQKVVNAEYEQVFPVEGQERDVDDNCSLMFLNKPNLLNNVKVRYQRDCIYTYVANILIAVNPYMDIPKLYSKDTILKYKGKSMGVLPPHVYAIADQAYRNMKITNASQSLIVSGESGAGKTETTKYILQYLTECYGARAGPIEQRIIESNPLLEAFGNAKTVRNNNSSRSGKFVEIHFDKNTCVTGGFVSHYLLEKSRICKQSSNERNYHIFYRMCAGMPKAERDRIGLKSPDHYNYLKNGTTRYFCTVSEASKLSKDQTSDEFLKCGVLSDIQLNDIADFNKTYVAMKDMGISQEECKDIFSIVGAILHLGNIEFEEVSGSQGGCGISAATENALKISCQLLGFDDVKLADSLCNRYTKASQSARDCAVRIALRVEDAQSARDALSKALYVRLFDQIVSFVNRALPFKESSSFIGILDIAGFEFFERNSFEQFCINYCNEKMQQFFNQRILLEEQILYETEGLRLKRINYIDNQDCIDIIEKKSAGIIDLLDEESKLPKPSTEHFTQSLFSTNPSAFRLELPRKSKLKAHREVRDTEGFIIRHYAGAVCYHTDEFLDKNNDALHDSLRTLLETSSVQLMKVMFPKEEASSGLLLSNKKTTGTGKLAFISVASKFRSQLIELMEKLKQTGSNFIRCIKPNEKMIPKSFEGGNILSQLECSGMTSVLDLMQQGFPSRINFADLYGIYNKILPKNLSNLDPKLFCRLICKVVGLSDSDFKFGMTKVFFRPSKMAEFDRIIRSDPENIKTMVKRVQQWLIRFRWRKAQYGVWEVIKLKNKIKWRRLKIIDIQKTLRMWILRKKYGPKIKGLVKLRTLNKLIEQLGQICLQLKKSKDKGNNLIEKNKKKITAAESQIKSLSIKENSKISNIIKQLRFEIEKDICEIKTEVDNEKITLEKERLRKIQEEMELQRRKAEEEAERLRKEEEEKQRRIEIENRRKAEKLKAEKTKPVPISPVKQQQENTEQYIRDLTKQQEQRDRELALRITQGDINGLEETVKSPVRTKPTIGGPAVTDYTYDELRRIINQSTDIKLIEACQAEFQRRINTYNHWKTKQKEKKNSKANTPVHSPLHDTFTPSDKLQEIAQSTFSQPSNHEQRFFSMPFKTSSGKNTNGIWLAHFDGEYIARQIEIHDEDTKVLLIAGVDDLAMCDLPLSSMGLTTRKGVEITENEFETKWKEFGGLEVLKQSKNQILSQYVMKKFFKTG